MATINLRTNEPISMVIVLMGVAGSGKTVVGEALAKRLGWPLCDADNLHSADNRQKMSRGIPLTEEDRQPWLAAVRASIAHFLSENASAIIACSALRHSYRERLAIDHRRVRFVYLKGSSQLIAQRLAARQGHFFDPKLLASQFDDLEEPSDALVMEISASPEEIATSIVAALGI